MLKLRGSTVTNSPRFERTAPLGFLDITDWVDAGVRVTVALDAVKTAGGVDVIAVALRDRLGQHAIDENETIHLGSALRATNVVSTCGRLRFINIQLATGV